MSASAAPISARQSARAAQAPGRGPRALLRRHRSLSIIIGMVIVGALLPFIVLLPPLSGFSQQRVWVDSFADAGIYVLLALGLNVVVGFAGLLDLGYAAFFAIGAYGYAFAASSFLGLHVPFWPMLIVGAVLAGIFGILLGAPTLRLRGDYLAIVTLGFGEIVPVVFKNASALTNGTNGISGLDRPSLPPIDLGFLQFSGNFSSNNPYPYYLTMVVIITFVLILLYRLQDSRVGRAWMAIREDELAAASNGINTVTTKLLAFALGASTAGFAGVFGASKLVFVSPESFGFNVSFTVLAMVVLGGMGNSWGVAAGAFIVFAIQNIFLKQLTNFVHTLGLQPIDLGLLKLDIGKIDFVQYQFLLYGIALVGMMLLRPEGLFPSQRRRQELHAAEPDIGADKSGSTPGADESGSSPGAEIETELR